MFENRKKKIFVTGGLGFIGNHLLNEFKNSEFELIVLSKNECFEKINNVSFIQGNINEIFKLSDTIADCSYFIHMVGEKKNNQFMYKINVEGTNAVLDVLIKYPHVKLIHLSSSGVYGMEHHPEKNIDEDSKCLPRSTYEITKYQAEENIRVYSSKHKLNYVILRPSNVFGEMDVDKKLLNLFKSLMKGRFVYLNNSTMLNYVYVKYLTKIIFQLVQQNIFDNQAYNVNSPCNIKDFIEFIKKDLNINSKTILIPKVLVYPIAKIGDFLPNKYQYINSNKYYELVNNKVFLVSKINSKLFLENNMLFEGLKNLLNYYKHNNWL